MFDQDAFSLEAFDQDAWLFDLLVQAYGSIEEAVHAALAPLVGGRAFPLVRPQGQPLPAIVYHRVATAPLATLQGDAGKDAVRLQINSWAEDFAAARGLGDQVRTALEALVFKTALIMDLEDFDPAVSQQRVIQDYRIWT